MVDGLWPRVGGLKRTIRFRKVTIVVAGCHNDDKSLILKKFARWKNATSRRDTSLFFSQANEVNGSCKSLRKDLKNTVQMTKSTAHLLVYPPT